MSKIIEKIHPWQEPPIVNFHNINNNVATHSIVMPIFNQEKNISKILDLVIQNTTLAFDLILINDGSTDLTLNEINRFSASNLAVNSPLLCKIAIINNLVPIYETACDNQGFRLANTPYIIEIQSDIYINEFGYDQKMIRALDKFSLGAVSGRLTHQYSLIQESAEWKSYSFNLFLNRHLFKREGAGRLGSTIFELMGATENVCYISETVARGPIAFRKSGLEDLGYLDEAHFFLGNDDHDLCRRMFQSRKQKVGYVPIQIHSIRDDGSTRQARTGLNEKVYEYLKANKTGSPEFKNFLESYKPYQPVKKLKLA